MNFEDQNLYSPFIQNRPSILTINPEMERFSYSYPFKSKLKLLGKKLKIFVKKKMIKKTRELPYLMQGKMKTYLPPWLQVITILSERNSYTLKKKLHLLFIKHIYIYIYKTKIFYTYTYIQIYTRIERECERDPGERESTWERENPSFEINFGCQLVTFIMILNSYVNSYHKNHWLTPYLLASWHVLPFLSDFLAALFFSFKA